MSDYTFLPIFKRELLIQNRIRQLIHPMPYFLELVCLQSMYLDTITYLLRLFILGWALHKVLSDEMRRTVHKLVCPTRRPKNLSETHGTGNFNLNSCSLLFLMNAFYIAIADQPFTNRHSAITFWYVTLHPFYRNTVKASCICYWSC